jgi:hypothetical protein
MPGCATALSIVRDLLCGRRRASGGAHIANSLDRAGLLQFDRDLVKNLTSVYVDFPLIGVSPPHSMQSRFSARARVKRATAGCRRTERALRALLSDLNFSVS